MNGTPTLKLASVPKYLTSGVQLPPVDALAGLSPSERRVFELIALGYPKKRIAAMLFRSTKTIDRQTHALYAKLGIRDRVVACRYAQACGILADGQLTAEARMVS